jgi:UMF1 family MFS transporter
MIAFFLYFSQWLVIDRGISDFWFNLTLTAASLLFLLVGPVLGSIADKTNNKIKGIRITTITVTILYLITGSIATFFPNYDILAAIFFTLSTAVYLLSFTYYNAFLKDLAPPKKRGAVSGWGLFGNYLGQIAAILIALPFVTGAIHLWGAAGRAQAFIPATIIFFLLSLPLLFTFKDAAPDKIIPANFAAEYRNIWSSFKNLCRNSYIGRFFLAYFFFNDAVLTAANNFPIYMERVFGADDTFKSYVMLGILITSAIGSLLSGWVADRIGHKKTLMIILGGWIVIFPLLAFTSSLTILVVITVIMGLWFGSAWTVTRAMVIDFAPDHQVGQSLSYFTLMERFATLVGPLTWGLIVVYAPQTHSFNYRGAAFAMVLFIIIGLLIAQKLPGKSLSESKGL